MLAQPTLKRGPDLAQWLRRIDIGLGNVRQFPAKRREQGPTQWSDEALEMIHLSPFTIHQGGANFDDFHFSYWPATLIGGGFQIYDQPVRHRRVPGIRVLIGFERSQTRRFRLAAYSTSNRI
jgi:hypothetical protein